MSGFETGDVVVCVDDNPCNCCGQEFPIAFRKTYQIKDVQGPAVNARTNELILSLVLEGVPFAMGIHEGWGFASRRFRKIQKANGAFTAQMRALKPVKQQA